MSEPAIFTEIREQITGNDIVLYMKGTAAFPMCGFSAAVVQIMNTLGAPFQGFNVLENEELRQGIKDFTNWPTIPQLYVKGEFVGGCDIVREMYENGELRQLLADKNIVLKPVDQAASA
jgi:monothiol glutaredoxin